MAYEKQTWACGEVITADKLNHMEDGIANAGGEAMESITYAELKAKRDNGTLTPGMQYRITDYECTTTQEGSRAVAHSFDIIVVADGESALNENARACLREGDTYYSASNHDVNLEAWELKYCIDNDTDRFAWADTTNGKGVIYWLKDEKNNECPYDFKQIQFSRDNDGTTNWYYTFSARDGEATEVVSEDASVSKEYDTSSFIYGNVIRPYRYFKDREEEYGLYIQYLNSITFDNLFGYGCYGNTFGCDCHDITFGYGCNSNTFGDECYDITLGDSCEGNTFGDTCTDITFGFECNYNTFKGCFSITFGHSCVSNTFGYGCGSNTFGEGCNSNTVGDSCVSITFGADCNNNTVESSSGNITFGDYCYGNTVENMCSYIDLTAGVSYRQPKQSYHVLSGTRGTSGTHITVDGTNDNNFETYVGKNSSGIIKTWVPADSVQ